MRNIYVFTKRKDIWEFVEMITVRQLSDHEDKYVEKFKKLKPCYVLAESMKEAWELANPTLPRKNNPYNK